MDQQEQNTPQWVLDFRTLVAEVEAVHGPAQGSSIEATDRIVPASTSWGQRREYWHDRQQMVAIWEIIDPGHDRTVFAGFSIDAATRHIFGKGWRHDPSGRYPARVQSKSADLDSLRLMVSRIGLLPARSEPKVSTGAQLERALLQALGSAEGDLPRSQVEKILSDYRAGTLPRVR